MNREEQRIARDITSGLSRRHFLRATGAAALGALAAAEPRLVASATKIPARADRMILLWMAGGMAQTETFDPKRYTPYQSGPRIQPGAQHLPQRQYRGRRHTTFRRTRRHRKSNGPRYVDPIASRRRSGLHPSFASSVPLAHRLSASTISGGAAYGRVHLTHAGPAESGHTGVY